MEGKMKEHRAPRNLEVEQVQAPPEVASPHLHSSPGRRVGSGTGAGVLDLVGGLQEAAPQG